MNPKPKAGTHLIVTYGDNGAIEMVSINTPLEIVYDGMFKDAERRMRRKTTSIEDGIKAIVFGCFWIEARTNNVMQDFLWRSLGRNPIREHVWQQLKKSSIMEKLSVIGTLCTPQEVNQLQSLTPRLRKAFELRNRLAHFKAEEEPAPNTPTTVAQVIELAMTLPETELVSILTSRAVMKEHAAAIRDGADWLESVRSSKLAAQQSVQPTSGTPRDL
jgi:hypothetical protein